MAVREQSEVTDADQSSWKYMDEEAAEEVLCGNSHDLLLATMGVVLPTEGDTILLEADQAMVGDGDAVCVASEILKQMFRPAEGRLGVYDPVLAVELTQEATELRGLSKLSERAVELELTLLEQPS